MPDLGRYATEVLSAYAGALSLLALLIAISIWRARKVREELRQAEARREARKS